ncbi:glycosyl transferase, partial [Bacillus wiedmannii]
FKDGYIFIGPSIVKNETLNDFPVDELKGERVIYISMGTIITNQPEFYQKCFVGLKDLNAKVVLSIGKQLTVEQLGDIPDNFIVRNYLPQLDILRQAD